MRIYQKIFKPLIFLTSLILCMSLLSLHVNASSNIENSEAPSEDAQEIKKDENSSSATSPSQQADDLEDTAPSISPDLPGSNPDVSKPSTKPTPQKPSTQQDKNNLPEETLDSNKTQKYPSAGVFNSPTMDGRQARTSLPVTSVGRVPSAKLPNNLSTVKFYNPLIRKYGNNLIKVTKKLDKETTPLLQSLSYNNYAVSLLDADLLKLQEYKENVDSDPNYNLNPEIYSKIVFRITELSENISQIKGNNAVIEGRLNILQAEKNRIIDIIGFYKAVDNIIKGTPFPKSQVKPLLFSTASPFESFPSKILQQKDWNSLHSLTYSDVYSDIYYTDTRVTWKAPVFNKKSQEYAARSTSSLPSLREYELSNVADLPSELGGDYSYNDVFTEMSSFNPLLSVKVDKKTATRLLKSPHAETVLVLPVVTVKTNNRVLTVAGVDAKAMSILDVPIKPAGVLGVVSTATQSALSLRQGDLVNGKRIFDKKLTHGGIGPTNLKPYKTAQIFDIAVGGFQDLPLGIGAIINEENLPSTNDYILLFNNDSDFRKIMKYIKTLDKNSNKGLNILRKTPAPSLKSFYTPAQASSVLGSGSFVKVKRSDPDAIALPSSFTSKHLKTNKFPVLGTFTCSRFAAKQLAGALAHAAVAGLSRSLVPNNFGGCYSPRFMRTTPRPSYHAWGLAIDLDPSNNQLYSVGTLDRRLVPIFKSWGFRWGGDWRTLDPMHFEVAKLMK